MLATGDSGEVAPDGPIIEARGVTKTYDTGTVQVKALKGVDLTIRRGEMVSVMGQSGSSWLATAQPNCGRSASHFASAGLTRRSSAWRRRPASI